MYSLTSGYLTALRFDGSRAALLRALGGYQGRQQLYARQSLELLKGLRQIAALESTGSSSRLEGVAVAPARLNALVFGNAIPRGRAEEEVAGYRDALALVHELAEHLPFGESAVLQLHALLCRYMPQEGGRWKTTDASLIGQQPDGGAVRLRLQPVAAHRTPAAMAGLTGHYASALERQLADPLVLIPLAVLDFLCIQPFSGGNGHMSRLLTLLLLCQCDYDVGRYISLERIFEDTRKSYYETLEASSQGWHQGRHDARPWLDYFWAALLQACRELEERVAAGKRGRGNRGERVRAEVLGRNQPFSIADIWKACPGVSRDMVRLVLRAMHSEGLIESSGQGRGAQWRRTAAGGCGNRAALRAGRKRNQ